MNAQKTQQNMSPHSKLRLSFCFFGGWRTGTHLQCFQPWLQDLICTMATCVIAPNTLEKFKPGELYKIVQHSTNVGSMKYLCNVPVQRPILPGGLEALLATPHQPCLCTTNGDSYMLSYGQSSFQQSWSCWLAPTMFCKLTLALTLCMEERCSKMTAAESIPSEGK